MMEIKAKTRKWGNSIGVIIPKEVIRQQNITPDQEVTILINSKPITTGKDIWGTFKSKKSTEQLMREADKDFNVGF